MAKGHHAVSEWVFKESIDTEDVRQIIVSAQSPVNENHGYIKDGDDVFVAFAKLCAGLKQVIRGVKSLKMDKWSFTDSGLLALVAILEAGHFNDLRELAIYGFSTYNFPVAGQKFCDLLQSGRLYNLRTLDVSGNGFGRKGVEMLMKSLGSDHSGKLEALHVIFGEVGNRQVKFLVGTLALGHLRNLQTLDLTGNKLQAEGVESLAAALLSGLLKSLKSLKLPDNAIGDAGAESLAASLESSGNLSALESLDLSSNQLGDVGVAALARSFRSGKCGKLRNLDLSRNQFGSKGLEALAEVFESGSLSELETVDLTFIRADFAEDDSSHGIIQTARALKTGPLASVKDLLLFDSWRDIDGLLPTVKHALLECYRENPYLVARICLEHEAYAKTRDTEKLNTLRWRNVKRVARLEKWQNDEEISGREHGKVIRGDRGVGKTTAGATWMKERLTSRSACIKGRWIPFCGDRKRQREAKDLPSLLLSQT